jgi:hypothetical protein
MTPAPQKKMENPQRPSLTPDAMSAMQTPDPTMNSPEMLKAKNNLRRIIQQVGIDPQRIIQAGKYAETALQDPKMYPMAIQNAVKSGLLTQEQVPKTPGVDYKLLAQGIAAGKLTEQLVKEGAFNG